MCVYAHKHMHTQLSFLLILYYTLANNNITVHGSVTVFSLQMTYHYDQVNERITDISLNSSYMLCRERFA